MKNSHSLSRTESILLTAGCFLAFFLFGFTDNLKGPILPALLTELHIEYGTGGNIFFGQYLGFLIATLITGIFSERFGLKSVLVLAGIMLAVGISGFSTLQTPLGLGLALLVLGLALGAFELGPNSLIVLLHQERKGLFLNLMAVLHGFGSMIAPIYAGWMLAHGVSWRSVYQSNLVLVGIYIATMAFLTFPAQKEGEKIDFKNIRKVAFQGNLPWYHASLAFYVATEIGAGSWLVTYLQQFRAWDIPSSNQALSLFFGSIMAGRLVGGFLVHRIGYLRSVLLAACGAFVFFAAGTLTTYSILIALAGIFLSIIFPTITAAVTDEIHDNHGTVLGALFTFAGLGGMLGPWLVAWVSDLFGLQIGFFLIPFFTAIMIPIFIFIMRGQHGKNP